MTFFMSRTNFLFDNRKLLNLHEPYPLWPSLIIFKENKIGDWSLQNKGKTSVL